jgi:N-acetylglutamate synthase-like GNAT family acetyltransferase
MTERNLWVERRRVTSGTNPKDFHIVTSVDGTVVACTCLGFKHRTACAHMKGVVEHPDEFETFQVGTFPVAAATAKDKS